MASASQHNGNPSLAHAALTGLSRTKSGSASTSLFGGNPSSSNLPRRNTVDNQRTRKNSTGASQLLKAESTSSAEEGSSAPAPLSTISRSTSTSGQQGKTGGYLEAKVVILGSQGVGKTSLVHRYTTGQFSNSLTSTIGASFLTKRIVLPEGRVMIQLWDTAGQERFRSMAAIYYRGSQAALLVYDITNADSFNDIKIWLDELQRNMTSDLIVHVVGAKSDLSAQRAVPLDFARKQVRSWLSTSPSSPHLDSIQSPPSPSATLSTAGSNYFDLRNGAGGASRSSNGSKALSGLGFSRGRRSEEASRSPDPEEGPAWCEADVSEVSAKDDNGVEDLFLSLTTRLIQRKAQIERERIEKARNSILLTSVPADEQPQSASGYACC